MCEKEIVVEMVTDQDLDKIISYDQLKSDGYDVKKAGAAKPRILIFDVPSELNEYEVASTVLEHNDDLKSNLNVAEFMTNFKLKLRMGKRNEALTNWVAEVTLEVRIARRSTNRSRIYIGCSACRFEDFIAGTRCFKC